VSIGAVQRWVDTRRRNIATQPMARRTYRVFQVGFSLYTVVWLWLVGVLGTSSLPLWAKVLLFVPLLVGGPTLGAYRSYSSYCARWRRAHGLSPEGEEGKDDGAGFIG
jgi:hypothetical protein